MVSAASTKPPGSSRRSITNFVTPWSSCACSAALEVLGGAAAEAVDVQVADRAVRRAACPMTRRGLDDVAGDGQLHAACRPAGATGATLVPRGPRTRLTDVVDRRADDRGRHPRRSARRRRGARPSRRASRDDARHDQVARRRSVACTSCRRRPGRPSWRRCPRTRHSPGTGWRGTPPRSCTRRTGRPGRRTCP